MHILIVLAFAVAMATAPQTHAAKKKPEACPKAIADEANARTLEPTTEGINELDLTRVLNATAGWVKKNRTIPGAEELALALKLPVSEVQAFLSRNDTPDDLRALVVQAREHYPHHFSTLQAAAARHTAKFLRNHFRAPSLDELADLLGAHTEDLGSLYALPDNLKAFAEEHYPLEIVSARKQLAKAFAKASKDMGRLATPSEVAAAMGTNVEALQGAFGPSGLFESDEELKSFSQTVTPSSFTNVVDTDIHSEERTQLLLEAVKNRKRLFLVTAVAGIGVEEKAFESLLTMARHQDAEVIVYPANMQTHGLDPVLFNTPGVHILTHSLELSPWLSLDNIKLIAKQINPLMGLDRLGEPGQSLIVGSPKMHVKTLPTKSTFTPKKLMTTGAITRNQYSGPRDRYIKQRTSRIAKKDHVIGALVLEKRKGDSAVVDIESAGHFYARHIEYIPEAEGFVDLGTLYSGQGRKKVGIEAAVLGDVHVGMTDEHLMDSLRDQILSLKPKLVVLHDLMDGRSINHHEKDRLLSLAQKADRGLLDLGRELDQVTAFVNSLLAIQPSMTVVVVPSNHDGWLHSWLDSGQFMKENQNRSLGLKLAAIKNEGKDVFREALMEGIEYPKRVVFLERGRDFRVGPEHRRVEIGQHGDRGANGARASLKSLGVSFGRVVYGHSHTDARQNGAVNIGTFTPRVVPYSSEGTSSWAQSMALIDPYGGIQVLEYFDGGWYSRPEQTETDPETFFWPGFPKAVPNDPDSLPEQLDQWS